MFDFFICNRDNGLVFWRKNWKRK